ncbi:MAG: response regulator [Chloroflexi bacterium]|nr:response regulator [Chloroflexota bacterium]
MSGNGTDANAMGKKVLVVDDQELVREVLADCLELGGYEPCLASNGDEGLRQLHEHQPDLVITDMRMPGMDGYEFCRLIRNASSVPIIMLTGLAGAAPDAPSLNLVDAFIAKPVKLQELLAQVGALLSDDRRVGEGVSVQ